MKRRCDRVAREPGAAGDGDLGVLEVAASGLKMLELADGVTKEEVTAKTGVPVDFSTLH